MSSSRERLSDALPLPCIVFELMLLGEGVEFERTQWGVELVGPP